MAAEFTIDDTDFDTLGFDAEHDAVLDLALADSTGLDAARVVFSVVLASADAPELVFSPVTGIPATPTGTVTVTMPSTGVHSWRIQCQVSGGYDASGRWDATLTRERIICIRSANLGLRKLVPGETTQYEAVGWSEEQNRAVDLLDTYGLGGDGFPFHDGIVFPTDANYRMIQEQAENGIAPVQANIKAQSAGSGDTENGGALRLAGGDAGDPAYYSGDVIVELGTAVATTTAALSLQTLSSEIMRILQYAGTAAVRAAGSLSLLLHSSQAVQLSAGSGGVVATLSSGRSFALSFVERFTMSGGQRQVLTAGGTGFGGTIQFDFDESEKWSITLTSNGLFDEPLNILPGATYTIRIQQDVVGSRTGTWDAAFLFGSLTGTLSTAPNAVDIFVFEGSANNTLHCLIAAKGVHL